MIEEEGPALSAANAETVEEGAAQARAGSWALPEAGSIVTCPKCWVGNEDGGNRFHIRYHLAQKPYDIDSDIDTQLRDVPCSFLRPEDFPVRMPWGIGGEHLCVTCTRCGFGWCERVVSSQPSPYEPTSEEGEE